MARGSRPPPLNLSLDTRSKNLPQILRNNGPAVHETTPLMPVPLEEAAAAAAAMTVMKEKRGRSPGTTRTTRTVRLGADFLHLVAATMLLLIMAFFLEYQSRTGLSEAGANAIVAIVALGLDVALDLRSIGLYDRDWSGRCLLSRATITFVYAVLLVSSAAIGEVFPEDYTYWGATRQEANVSAIVFICGIL
ncbi:hypothetical protein S40293_06157 [Stachybotrys chartarum IBT 40293]|nr:hypothetical protein S40293_06157 [Stachybotrys chartarum IBT 40293]